MDAFTRVATACILREYKPLETTDNERRLILVETLKRTGNRFGSGGRRVTPRRAFRENLQPATPAGFNNTNIPFARPVPFFVFSCNNVPLAAARARVA